MSEYGIVVCVCILFVHVCGGYMWRRDVKTINMRTIGYACILISVHTGQMWLQILVSGQTYIFTTIIGTQKVNTYAHCNSCSVFHYVAYI